LAAIALPVVIALRQPDGIPDDSAEPEAMADNPSWFDGLSPQKKDGGRRWGGGVTVRVRAFSNGVNSIHSAVLDVVVSFGHKARR
jgi:hypothetical protein